MTIQRETRRRAIDRQIQRLQRRIERMRSRSSLFTRYRLGIFIFSLVAGAISNFTIGEAVAWPVFTTGLLVFGAVATIHRRLNHSIKRHEIWLRWKTQLLARMQLDWQQLPFTEQTPADPEHPFEFDLDITGPRSLHRLLDTAVSKAGSARLRTWLLRTDPDLKETRRRQKIVRELIPLSHFRNKLYLQFTLVSSELLDGDKLVGWLKKQETPRTLKIIVAVLSAMALVNISLFGLYQFCLLAGYYIWTLIAYIFVFLMNQKLIASVFADTNFLEDELAKVRAILEYLESFPYQQNQALSTICEPFWKAQTRPSQQIRKVKWIAYLVGLRGNPLLNLVLNITCPYDYYCAVLLDRSKKQLARTVPGWLDTFYELEALLSLANAGYLNPDYTFPTFNENEGEHAKHKIELVSIGHPLIPQQQKVCNDFMQEKLGTVTLITGSNMAGKSTFLKTLGINFCLAYVGGVVDAKKMECSLFKLFTCLKVNDSVTDGFSFFYAEVRRLKSLLSRLDQSDSEPIFFLIDEIFRGTNNRERLIGSRSYIRALANKHGMGAISTHDLELVHLADEIASISNFHFREEVVDGKMTFDYKLRTGPCPTTNALKIMELEGLPVEQS